MIRVVRVLLRWESWLVVAVLVFAVAFVRLEGFLIDDAFISVRYAKNLVEGHGLVFNPGERVEGYTNFLWTLLLAVPTSLHLPLVPLLKGLSAGFGIATAWATLRLTRTALGRRNGPIESPLEILPAVLWLASPPVILSAAEGLETMLFAFLLVLGTGLFLEESEQPEGWPRSAIALAALGMTRPDGAVFGVLLLALGIVQGRPLRQSVRFGIVFTVLFGAYFGLRAAYYGHPLPNTFYAKQGGDSVLFARGWEETMRFCASLGGAVWIAGLAALLMKGRRAVAATLALVVLARIGFQLWSGGPWMGRFRFLIPIVPILAVLTAMGLAALFRAARPRRLSAAVAAAFALAWGWWGYPQQEAGALSYGARLRAAHGALGQRIADHTALDAVIALDDAGLTPLLAERRTIDMLGLNDEHIAHLAGRFGDKFDTDYVLDQHPDLVVLIALSGFPTPKPRFLLPGHAAIFSDARFRGNYEYRRDFPFGPTYHLLVFRRRNSAAVPADF